jgi:hypothetical protein
MPPHPRNRPALEAALSRDTRRPGDHGWRSGNREPWLFLFGGGSWLPVEVLAWWEDDHGRTVVQVEYHAELSTWNGTYLFAAGKCREG